MKKYEKEFHVPVDSYIIEKVWREEKVMLPLRPGKKREGKYSNEKVISWSNWGETEYIDFQKGLREWCGQVPIDWEGPKWIDIAKERNEEFFKDIEGKYKLNTYILSRRAAEKLIRVKFPPNTAVISFHDPDKEPLDYSIAPEWVRYVSLGDMDTELSQSTELARFIHAARSNWMDILCQCEQGQSRSAACAAAILEHFEGKGSTILEDEGYYVDEMVYDSLLDALEEERNCRRS